MSGDDPSVIEQLPNASGFVDDGARVMSDGLPAIDVPAPYHRGKEEWRRCRLNLQQRRSQP
jgi:hypothetical protein